MHDLCENNTFFLSRAWRYFHFNGHSIVEDWERADLVFVGGCVVTDSMRTRCEDRILEIMQRLPKARFIVFGCLAAFPEDLRSRSGREEHRLHLIPFRATRTEVGAGRWRRRFFPRAQNRPSWTGRAK